MSDDSTASNDTGLGALVVDLEGPLTRTAPTDEVLWAALAEGGSGAVQALKAMITARKGSVGSTDLAEAVNPEALPYNDDLVGYLKQERSSGFQTVLLSRRSTVLAQRVAEHLGVFDQVIEPDGPEALEEEAITSRLDSSLGAGQYAFADGSTAASPAAAPATGTASALFKAMRPHQWMKNLLIFVPMFTAHQITSANIFLSILAFLAFSLVASSVYLLNDLLDLQSDRAHPRKRFRPFAAGDVSLRTGAWMSVGLLVVGFVIATLIGGPFLLVMLGYYLVTLAYSAFLKRKAILDICTLAGLYTLRIVAGGAALSIPISVWLLAFSVFFFFALASIKRQAELVDAKAASKLGAKGRDYRVEDIVLVSQMAVSSGFASVLVLALYLNSPVVQELYDTPELMWGMCLVLLYWLNRAVWKAHRGEMEDDPLIFALTDPISRVALLVMLAVGIAATVI